MYEYNFKKNKVKPKSKVLIIAGSDSSGGAGIQADIKTVTALGSYAMTAITAVTAQNTTGVKSIVSIPPSEILNQILFTIKDIKPNAIKIGMLHSNKVINSVIRSFKNINLKEIDIDAENIRRSIIYIDGINQKFDIEKILDIIFSDFCIGK